MSDPNPAQRAWKLPSDVFYRAARELAESAEVVAPLVELVQSRRGWFHANYECVTPTDPTERTEYLAELADEAEHGPSAGQEASA